jgi:2'-5' RNA ligase
MVDPNDVYHQEDLGLEMKPHVTVVWGFDDSKVDIETLQRFCWRAKTIDIEVKSISFFEPDEVYDVVKFDIKSKDLQKLNASIERNFDIKNTYPDYKPHMTIAYVKKGRGKKYNRKLNTALNLTPHNYRYTGPNGRLEIFEGN